MPTETEHYNFILLVLLALLFNGQSFFYVLLCVFKCYVCGVIKHIGKNGLNYFILSQSTHVRIILDWPTF